MSLLQKHIHSLGDLAATHELYALGFGRARLRRAFAAGEIVRVRKGWYANTDLHPELRQAACVGGRLAAVSAARHHGLWIPDVPSRLQVQVQPQACQLRTRSDFRRRLTADAHERVDVLWEPFDAGSSRVLVAPSQCLRQLLRRESAEFGFIVAESARYAGLVSRFEWEELRLSLPYRTQAETSQVDENSESGSESAFKFRMLKHYLPMRQQMWIGQDRVDFLIGERLVVEIDSRAHHDPVADCARDARLSIRHHRVLRFYYEHVFGAWDLVEDAVLAAVERGDHLAP
jgi:very-short-patch-repair endonuclease